MRFAVLCPPALGHLYPFFTLADELKRRGHVVLFYQIHDFTTAVLLAGHETRTFGIRDFPQGRWTLFSEKFGAASGKMAMNQFIEIMQDKTRIGVRELPALLADDQIDAILADQVGLESSTIAEILDVPFVTLCNAVTLDTDPLSPPFFTTWSPARSPFARLRNRTAYALLERKLGSTLDILNRERAKLGLKAIRRRSETYSRTLKLIRLYEEFDFPRTFELHAKWIGPLIRVQHQQKFDLGRLSATKPIVFVSMGSEVNRQFEIFAKIQDALYSDKHQLVMTLGRASADTQVIAARGDTLVCAMAPQYEILKRANLFVTHGGVNSVLESISLGVPMLAIPATNDQFGVAARIQHHGVGRFVRRNEATSSKLRRAFHNIQLERPRIIENIRRVAGRQTPATAAERAADLILHTLGAAGSF